MREGSWSVMEYNRMSRQTESVLYWGLARWMKEIFEVNSEQSSKGYLNLSSPQTVFTHHNAGNVYKSCCLHVYKSSHVLGHFSGVLKALLGLTFKNVLIITWDVWGFFFFSVSQMELLELCWKVLSSAAPQFSCHKANITVKIFSLTKQMHRCHGQGGADFSLIARLSREWAGCCLSTFSFFFASWICLLVLWQGYLLWKIIG